MQDPNKEMWRQAAPLLTIGMEIALAVIGCTWAGAALDGHFKTTPWCLMGGFGLGCAASVRALMRLDRTVQKMNEDDEGGPPSQDP